MFSVWSRKRFAGEPNALVDADGLVVHQIEHDVLIFANLYDSRDSFVGIFRGHCVGVVHFEKCARHAIRAKGGPLIHIHENDIDIYQSTPLDSERDRRVTSTHDAPQAIQTWPDFRPIAFQIIKKKANQFQPNGQWRTKCISLRCDEDATAPKKPRINWRVAMRCAINIGFAE